MSNFNLLILCVSLVLVSSMATDLIRRISIKNKLYDVPNNRSSHHIPTPRGGGVVIILTLLITIAILTFNKEVGTDFSISMLIGISIIATIGLIDDIKNLPVLIRAIAYVLGAVLSIYLIGGFSSLSINNFSIHLSYFGYILSVLFVVWLTNLYNFMDGTDGFAAIQTICVALFCGLLLFSSDNMSFAIILFCLASSTIGFLILNWAPAKIFMGDVGSCTLGFLFGLFSIYTEKNGIISIGVWIILLAPFIGDATFTLLKRIINGEKWYKAHNSHAYQKLYQLGVSHRNLAISLLLTNVLIIWPFAYFANAYKNLEITMIILSYCVIASIWFVVQNRYQKINTVSC
jgi:glycosyltransferase WbpL